MPGNSNSNARIATTSNAPVTTVSNAPVTTGNASPQNNFVQPSSSHNNYQMAFMVAKQLCNTSIHETVKNFDVNVCRNSKDPSAIIPCLLNSTLKTGFDEICLKHNR